MASANVMHGPERPFSMRLLSSTPPRVSVSLWCSHPEPVESERTVWFGLVRSKKRPPGSAPILASASSRLMAPWLNGTAPGGEASLYNESYGSKAKFSVMCPHTPYWQSTIADVVGSLVASREQENGYGTDGDRSGTFGG